MTATFLFTDVEGSTRLWEEQPAEMQRALERHDEILRTAIKEHDGWVFATTGDGFAVAFTRVGDAVDTAADVQRAFATESWPTVRPVSVRMGLHTGEASERDGDYFGPVLNRAARIMTAGHGGQILVGATTASLLEDVELVDLGEQRLKDLPGTMLGPERSEESVSAGAAMDLTDAPNYAREQIRRVRGRWRLRKPTPGIRVSLSGREVEVLRLIAEGLTTREYVLRWDERPGAGPAEYEAAQRRILDVFGQWDRPDGITFHQFVVRVGDWGGYAVIETDNLADIHVLTTALAAFPFRLEPVVDTMDAVAIELQAMAWREKVA